MSELPPFLSPKHTRLRVWTARGIAMLADAIQIVGAPLFGEGVASPFNDVLDIVVAILMIALLGWNFAFLPSLVAELVPFLDLAPTWTVAVLFVTRKGATATPPNLSDRLNTKAVVSKVVD